MNDTLMERVAALETALAQATSVQGALNARLTRIEQALVRAFGQRWYDMIAEQADEPTGQ